MMEAVHTTYSLVLKNNKRSSINNYIKHKQLYPALTFEPRHVISNVEAHYINNETLIHLSIDLNNNAQTNNIEIICINNKTE